MRRVTKSTISFILLLMLALTPLTAFANTVKTTAVSTHQIIDGYSYSNEVVQVFNDINRFREAMGLQKVKLDPVISEAAQNHAEYSEVNGTLGHTQEQGKPKFTGVTTSARVKAVGGDNYISSSGYFGLSEIISYHRYDQAIESLIYVPFHREPLIDTATVAVGIGVTDKAVVIDLTFDSTVSDIFLRPKNKQQNFVFPFNGQTDVPPVMLSDEVPSPLKGTKYKSYKDVGTVISIYINNKDRFDPTSVSLIDDEGKKVDVVVVKDEYTDYPLHEMLTHWYILPPTLKGNTTYTVKAHGKEWSFTTRATGAVGTKPPTKREPLKPGNIYISNTEQKSVEELKKRTQFFDTNSKSGYVNVLVNGKEVKTKPPAHIVNGSTFIPLRGVFEAIGAEVDWDGYTRTVGIDYGTTRVVLQIDNKVARVFTKDPKTGDYLPKPREVTLSTAPFVKEGSTFIPLRFVAESIGGVVLWHGEDFTASIIASYNIKD